MEDFYIIENNNFKLRELYLKILTLKKYKFYLIDKVENKIIEIKNNLKRDIKNNIKSKILKEKEKEKIKLDNKKNIIKNIKINKIINEKSENKINRIELNNEIKEIDNIIDSKKDEIGIIKDNINSEIINIEEIENKEKYKKKLNDGLENIDVGCVICCDGICGVCEYIKYEMSKLTNYINEILNNQKKKI